ncbi:MAG TPA: SDR family NAD(P)-dependent oxidoreductase [Chloroflexota bacterium]|nr:SDR family NAD(P)-dependent oxidoreductase [Chloroflexota bacterium]
MQGRVSGKVALVVGGGQSPGEGLGNGRATSILLAREGARVVVADRSLDSAQETARIILDEGGTASACEVDAIAEDSVQAMIAIALERYGQLDILHNNVGASIALGDAPADRLTEEAYDRSFAVNLKSAWLASKHALPALRERGGSIVNISSLAALEAYPLLGYKTMKAALITLTQSLAAGNARFGVRVNVILPGLMNTPMAIENRITAEMSREQVIAAREKRVPLRHKMGSAWDVAYAALFLHSDEAQFISGASLVVDGAASASFGSYD